MVLTHCTLGSFLGVGCHCFPPPLDVSTFSARCLHVQRRERPLPAEGGTLRGREMFRQISSIIRLPPNSRDLLHAANLRHGTDGFTSPPKEGVLRIFFALKNPKDRISLHLHSHEYIGFYELFYIVLRRKCVVLFANNTVLSQQLRRLVER